MIFLTVLAFILLIFVYLTVIVVPMREAVVVERLGRFLKVAQPGFHILTPLVDRVAYRHETREQVLDIPPQSCISRDNIQIEVDGLLYLKVVDPELASYGIANYQLAAINLAQTTMRSEVGKMSLSETFSEREALNDKIVEEIDAASSSWGIKVLRYEIMNIQPSSHVVATLEKQMEAEREKRSEITLATAEKEARINLSEGERQFAINISEGEKQKKINEAMGKGQKISLIAAAMAEGMMIVADAVNQPGGATAVKLKLIDQFVDELGEILKIADVSVVPAELAKVKGIFEGIDLVTNPLPTQTR
ncbi:MAG TPA: SPFH domain-containing protein [Oligoflexus sp.]|uniref:SPFH domain-containing protein n=1 Tax=Oligoflexus sp. TaxID=1971216 RepID=UPI002D40FAB8|nr:SPFH domain-containing protein [Oligoflexus sp.]HYX36479.1 SPFH domain-containing protein [Oligoflexus sp.]